MRKDERELLEAYRRMPEIVKAHYLGYGRGALNAQKDAN